MNEASVNKVINATIIPKMTPDKYTLPGALPRKIIVIERGIGQPPATANNTM